MHFISWGRAISIRENMLGGGGGTWPRCLSFFLPVSHQHSSAIDSFSR